MASDKLQKTNHEGKAWKQLEETNSHTGQWPERPMTHTQGQWNSCTVLSPNRRERWTPNSLAWNALFFNFVVKTYSFFYACFV